MANFIDGWIKDGSVFCSRTINSKDKERLLFRASDLHEIRDELFESRGGKENTNARDFMEYSSTRYHIDIGLNVAEAILSKSRRQNFSIYALPEDDAFNSPNSIDNIHKRAEEDGVCKEVV